MILTEETKKAIQSEYDEWKDSQYSGGYDTEDKPILVTKEEIDKIKQFNTVSDAFEYLHENQRRLPHYVVNGLYVASKG